ncbi:regulatory iron-sulfur-containing complex subunit RicT [uncultured Rubinisphaera sp.]|uniref:PSP1 domain-containing protein n=1 Tax=uncultured Rubinisphaera sp. TaxID=1678686 RepID=UPI000EE6C0B9|nr:signal peptidase [Planctomycetaceae bacterium]
MTDDQPIDQFIVRYGTTRFLGVFTWKGKGEPQRGNDVIIRSKRGNEWGEVLGPATERAKSFLQSPEPEGKIQRFPNADDYDTLDRCRIREQVEFDGCTKMILERKLQMQLVDVEHLFGGERAVFYFLAEKRIDFRELVKALAKEYSLRIEMRQIGVRDEAALLADYGDCGKPVCCNTHLSEMPPVSMKMAKVQKATLDPNKISGRCGRLKCCLRYEYDTYEEFQRELPKIGAEVVTREGQGKVIGQEILSKQVVIVYEDRRRITTPLQEIISVIKPKSAKKAVKKVIVSEDVSEEEE